MANIKSPAALRFVLGLGVGVLLALFVQVPTVTSDSMSPTVLAGSRLLLLKTDRLDSMFGTATRLHRGQLVVLRRSSDRSDLLLKRIVAVQGDRVRIQEGVLFVNDEPVVEPYSHHGDAQARMSDNWPAAASTSAVSVPSAHIFVLGDNRPASVDSRIWGAVRVSDVVGVVLLVPLL